MIGNRLTKWQNDGCTGRADASKPVFESPEVRGGEADTHRLQVGRYLSWPRVHSREDPLPGGSAAFPQREGLTSLTSPAVLNTAPSGEGQLRILPPGPCWGGSTAWRVPGPAASGQRAQICQRHGESDDGGTAEPRPACRWKIPLESGRSLLFHVLFLPPAPPKGAANWKAILAGDWKEKAIFLGLVVSVSSAFGVGAVCPLIAAEQWCWAAGGAHARSPPHLR